MDNGHLGDVTNLYYTKGIAEDFGIKVQTDCTGHVYSRKQDTTSLYVSSVYTGSNNWDSFDKKCKIYEFNEQGHTNLKSKQNYDLKFILTNLCKSFFNLWCQTAELSSSKDPCSKFCINFFYDRR